MARGDGLRRFAFVAWAALCSSGCAVELVEPTRSCRELAERGDFATGVYTMHPAGGATRVHCEMGIDGGGWTLVARSVAGGTGGFGWTVVSGSVDDPSRPYSAAAAALVPEAREILVTAHAGATTPTVALYRGMLPASFFSACADQGCEVDGPMWIGGEQCEGEYPAMLGNAGYTAHAESFVFRDHFEGAPIDLAWGLFPDGFELNFADCPTSGMLHQEQGLLFVR